MSSFSKRILLTGVLLAAIPWLLQAQGWIKTYGPASHDGGHWVEITADFGFIICGYTSVVDKTFDLCYLIKTDSEGDTLWTRIYAEPFSGRSHCVQQTADGGYILTGDGFYQTYDEDLWLFKTDSLGDSLWAHFYGEKGIDKGWFVRQTLDGGYIVAGKTGSIGDARQSLWILRTDSAGDTLWARTYGTGESNMYWAYCVNLISDGNYIVTGGDGSKNGLWLLKMDDAGDTIWTKTYVSGGDTWGRYVEETSDGGFIVTGANWDASNVYLLKTDSLGDSLWTRSYKGGAGTSEGRCVHQTPDGGYIIAAEKNFSSSSLTSLAWLLKTDATGDTLWTRSFGDARWYNDFRCVQLTPDESYIMTGKTGDRHIEPTYEPTDVWLVKTDSLGYVGIEEIDNPPALETATTVDTHITLYYTEHPNGFHANVYDASGQKVDEIHNTSASGTIEWGQGQQAGVYFIRIESGSSPSVQKVVLVR